MSRRLITYEEAHRIVALRAAGIAPAEIAGKHFPALTPKQVSRLIWAYSNGRTSEMPPVKGGPRHGRKPGKKLTKEEHDAILARTNERTGLLAKEFGVSEARISTIKHHSTPLCAKNIGSGSDAAMSFKWTRGYRGEAPPPNCIPSLNKLRLMAGR